MTRQSDGENLRETQAGAPMNAPDWTELEGYGHRIRYRWLDGNVEAQRRLEHGWEPLWGVAEQFFWLGWKAGATECRKALEGDLTFQARRP